MHTRQCLPQRHAAGGQRECILRETLAFFCRLGIDELFLFVDKMCKGIGSFGLIRLKDECGPETTAEMPRQGDFGVAGNISNG
ncbi:hypothetical protein A3842_10320 [Paenibacillus sp. P3E]|nr:hypothetical protein A3842_10320 [Paenibacillus sp. P3E]